MVNQHLLRFIKRGLLGIISPKADLTEFVKAVKSVTSGGLWFNQEELKKIAFSINDLKKEKIFTLKSREEEIVKHLCKGRCNKEIMQELNISEPTIRANLSRIYKKAGVANRHQLALYAMNNWPEYFF